MNENKTYTFTNYPIQCTKADYENAMNKIIELHKNNEEVTALYRFGTMSAVGISDIDFFIVTKGEDKHFRYRFPIEKLNEKEKYIMMHRPGAILSENILPNIQYIAPLFELECFYTKEGSNHSKNKRQAISKEEACIFLSDVLFMLYPKVFIITLAKKEIDIRHALTILYSLRYSIDLFGICGIKKQTWSKYIKDLTKLRREWFNTEKKAREDKLILLLNIAVSTCMDLLKEFDIYYRKKYNLFTTVNRKERLSFMAINHLVLFKEDYNTDDAQKEMFSFYEKNKLFLSILPISIAEQLKEYSLTKTIWGDYISAHLSWNECGKIPENKILNEIRMKRCSAMSELLQYSVRVRYRFGAFTPFNLGYLNYVPFYNQVREGLWKMCNRRTLKKIPYS